MKKWFSLLSLVIFLMSCGPINQDNPSNLNDTSLELPMGTDATGSKYKLPGGNVNDYRFRSLDQNEYREILGLLTFDALNDKFEVPYRYIPRYRVAIQNELLLFEPNLPDKDSVRWDILVNNRDAVTFESRSDMDLTEVFIQNKLDAGISIQEILDEVANLGGMVDDFIEVKNLLSTNKNGYVFLLKVPDMYYSVATFVVYPIDGKYVIYKAVDWNISSFPAMGRYYELYNIGDTNHNGIAEIIMQVEEGHSGMPQFWSQDINIIEWDVQTSSFKSNLVNVFAQSCDQPCEGKWKFLTLNSKDALIIENSWLTRGDCPVLISQRIYYWNGEKYEGGEANMISPNNVLSPECQIAWAETAVSTYEYDRANNFEVGWKNDLAINLIERNLQNWPEEADQIWGPASRDFAKLKLGIWYDYRGESKRAKTILSELSNLIDTSEYDLASRLAKKYLESREQLGLTTACQELSDNFMDEVLQKFPNPYMYDDIDSLFLQAFGTIKWKGDLCRPYEMFPTEFKYSGLTTFEGMEGWLLDLGLKINRHKIVELANDEFADLVLLENSEGNLAETWLLFISNGQLVAKYISDPPYYGEVPEHFVFEKLNVGQDVYLLKIDSGISVFQIISSGEINVLLSEFGVETFLVDNEEESPLRLIIDIDETGWYGRETIIYGWNLNSQDFTKLPSTYEAVQAEAEKKLYQENDYYGVIDIIDDFFKDAPVEPVFVDYCGTNVPDGCVYLPSWYWPYLQYLKGLAYERLGQFDKARDVYFQLWEEYPKNVFGVVASMKLEKVNR